MVHLIILAYLSVLLGDNGHHTLGVVGLTTSFVLAILLVLSWIGAMARAAHEDEDGR
jgi:hypothetical protein